MCVCVCVCLCVCVLMATRCQTASKIDGLGKDDIKTLRDECRVVVVSQQARMQDARDDYARAKAKK